MSPKSTKRDPSISSNSAADSPSATGRRSKAIRPKLGPCTSTRPSWGSTSSRVSASVSHPLPHKPKWSPSERYWRTHLIGRRPGSSKSSCSMMTAPLRMLTGSARSITQRRKLGFLAPRRSANHPRIFLNRPDFPNLPRAANAPLKAIPMSEMVGGPPTNTLVGMARLKVSGRSISFLGPFFLSLGMLGIPAI